MHWCSANRKPGADPQPASSSSYRVAAARALLHAVARKAAFTAPANHRGSFICPTDRRVHPMFRTPEIEAEILRRLTEGESLRSICRDEGYPAPSTVIKWTNEDPDGFGEQYTRACEARADVYFDRLDGVSDDAVAAESAVTVAGLRLKADNIKWQLARMAPKRYGDKVQQEVSGPGGGPVQFTGIAIELVAPKREA